MKITTKFTLTLIIAIIVALAVSGIQFSVTLDNELFAREIQSMHTQLDSGIQNFDSGIKQMQKHVRLLAANRLTQQWLSSPQENQPEHHYLASSFQQLLQQYNHYFQARLIAPDGMELLRVERIDGTIQVLPKERLQNKAHRYYVIEALRLLDRDVYFSPIDLNREHKQIEIPHKPTLRVATKVVAKSGELLGLVVLNANIRNMLNLNGAQPLAQSTYICNEKGYFIAHPQDEYTFGFEFKNDYRLASLLPVIYKTLKQSPQNSRNKIDASDMIAITSSYHFGNKGATHYLQFIQTIPKSVIHKKITDGLMRHAKSSLFLIICGLGAALAIGRLMSRRVNLVKKQVLKISEGDRERSIQPPKDEFDELLNAVDQMTQEISRNEEILRQKEKRLRAILDTVLNGVITIDSKGVIVAANNYSTDMFGYTPEELLDKNIKLLMPEHEAKHHDDHLKNYVNTGKPHIIKVPRDLEAKRKDRSTFPIQLSVSELIFENKQYFVGAIVDISERKQFEASLRESNNTLKKANQDLENYAYVASHDLQEPIRKIISFINILEDSEQENLSDYGKDILNRCTLSAAHMQKLIRSVLDLARIDTPVEGFHKLPLRPLVIAIADELKKQYQDAVFHIAELPTVNGVEVQIQQLAFNLMHNAVKFHKPGQPAVVSLSTVTDITNQYNKSAPNLVYFCIEDNGIGIQEKQRAKVFTPFARLHSRDDHEGTGIGLAICQKVIESHNGYINIEESTSGGCKFIVGLPAEE